MAFQDRLWASGLISRGDHVICAISGGPDSVALLWALYLLRDLNELKLEAVHFNHHLRGEESDRDEKFVRQFCAKIGIPLSVGDGKIEPRGKGLEDAARRARYGFFESLNPNAKIATAHTADDNAETLLLHLLRGTGLKGLGGIAPARNRYIRPMLSVTRRDVDEFIKEWNLSYVTDSSNNADDFTRNRLRHGAMPLFLEENPKFSLNCSRMAAGLREDEAYLAAQAAKAYKTVKTEKGLDCSKLLDLPPAMCSRVLAAFLREKGVQEPEYQQIARCRALAKSSNPSAGLNLPGGVYICRNYEELTDGRPGALISETGLELNGETRVSGWKIFCKKQEKNSQFSDTQFTFWISCDMIENYIPVVRSRRTGDTLCLSGGHKTLKKAMIDGKIPKNIRDSLPVIAAGPHILAAAGVGANRDFTPREGESAYYLEVRAL